MARNVKRETIHRKFYKSVTPLVTMEVNYDELQNFIKGSFEEEYGVDTIVDVEAVKYNPDIIDITVYSKRKKRKDEGPWLLN